MFARRTTSAAIAVAAIAGALFASPAAFADSRYQQIFPQGAHGSSHYDSRAHYQPRQTFTTPSDYVSSHVCINGYRYITRETDRWDNPAQNAIPVRC